MSTPVPRYVIGVSARTAETLAAQADTLATYLDSTERDPRRAAFAGTVTLASVAKTLLRRRETFPHRFAFVTATLAEAVESLRFFAEHPDSGNRLRGKGIYANRVEMTLFNDGLAADQEYVRQLAADGCYDRLAALWTVGFPINWSVVHPELDVELPAYLPPTPLSRRRFWPAPATNGRADQNLPQQPGPTTGQTPSARADVPTASTGLPAATPATESPATVAAAPSTTTAAVAPTAWIEAVVPTRAAAVTAATALSGATAATIASGAPESTTGDLRSELVDLPSTLRRQLLRTRLQGWIGGALAYSGGELPAVDLGFFDIGMTSIHLADVRAQISAALGFEPDETTAFDYPTITEFADYLERELDGAVAQPVSAPQLPPVRVEDTSDGENVLTALDSAAIDDLSPVELERVLTAIL
ncbi:phosphopantetheine-binding protein [Nocardia sp. CA-128927]|uniref:acyl carrier protein n=1 Tax=Nocardia sp. CA-128927 TaxID=3239975 RepID=UPI003D990ACD